MAEIGSGNFALQWGRAIDGVFLLMIVAQADGSPNPAPVFIFRLNEAEEKALVTSLTGLHLATATPELREKVLH